MPKTGQQLRLALERAVGRGPRQLELLHGDGVTQARVDGFVDGAHPAPADAAEHAVAIVKVCPRLQQGRMISAKSEVLMKKLNRRDFVRTTTAAGIAAAAATKPLFGQPSTGSARADDDDAQERQALRRRLRQRQRRRTPTASPASPRRSR